MQSRPARWLIAGVAIAVGVAARAEPARGEDRVVAQSGGASAAAPVIAPAPALPVPRRPVASPAARGQATVLPRDDAAARSRRSEENTLRIQRVARWRVLEVQNGDAHWYGHFHHGRRTASGERFDMNGLTAAHRDLALGSYARVTSLVTGRTVVVRINDRHAGPPHAVIDLARGAASELGIAGRGASLVRVEALVPP